MAGVISPVGQPVQSQGFFERIGEAADQAVDKVDAVMGAYAKYQREGGLIGHIHIKSVSPYGVSINFDPNRPNQIGQGETSKRFRERLTDTWNYIDSLF